MKEFVGTMSEFKEIIKDKNSEKRKEMVKELDKAVDNLKSQLDEATKRMKEMAEGKMRTGGDKKIKEDIKKELKSDDKTAELVFKILTMNGIYRILEDIPAKITMPFDVFLNGDPFEDFEGIMDDIIEKIASAKLKKYKGEKN